MRKLSKKSKIILISVLSAVTVLITVTAVFLCFMLDACEADSAAIEAFSDENAVGYTVKDNCTVFFSEGAEKGFILYPGAKVEHEAYIPLMEALAQKGVACFLVEMPLYFPLMDSDAAEKIRDDHPEIKEWYIGGHSLGGYAASLYLSKNRDKYEGLALLASYSGADLSDSGLSVLSVYGTEDAVMNDERYKEAVSFLPESFKEVIIEGGCHTFFGMYTGQDEDLAKISNEEQIKITADAIFDMMS